MTTDFQKTLAVLASVASVLAGVVTIASYLSGEDVARITTQSSDPQPIIINARAVFVDHNVTYIIDYDNNLITWNDSLLVLWA